MLPRIRLIFNDSDNYWFTSREPANSVFPPSRDKQKEIRTLPMTHGDLAPKRDRPPIMIPRHGSGWEGIRVGISTFHNDKDYTSEQVLAVQLCSATPLTQEWLQPHGILAGMDGRFRFVRNKFRLSEMQKAHSIFYGTILDAAQCDRTTYKELGLQCALCGAGVFWAEGEHQSAHFRHFPDRGDRGCENRAKLTLAADWERRRRSVEQQHLKYLQQNFWRIFSGVYAGMKLDELEASAKVQINEFPFNQMWEEWRDVVHGKRDAIASLTLEICEAMADGNYSVSQLDLGAEMFSGEANRIAQNLSLISQRNSAVGAVQFLLQPKSLPMLQILFFYAVFDYGCYSESMPDEFPQPINQQMMRLFYLWALTDIIGLLLAIPWAKSADAIRQTNSIPSSLQSNIRPRLHGLKAIAFMGDDAPTIFGA